MADAAHAPTASEYIVHHLTHLNTTGKAQAKVVDFSVYNLDTIFWAVAMAARHSRKAVSDAIAADQKMVSRL